MPVRNVLSLTLVALFLSACGVTGPLPVPQRPPGDAGRGQALFTQARIKGTPGCVTCHSLEPGKVIVGPSLAQIATDASDIIVSVRYTGSAKNSADFLRESIGQPGRYVEGGFAHQVMPEWMGILSQQDIEDLVAFLSSRH